MSKTRVSKKWLEIELSKLQILEQPNIALEQYPISANVASELLYMAGFEHNDLHGKIVDLGTGTGILAIGAGILGATDITGVDIDQKMLKIARSNAKQASVKVKWIHSDISRITGKYDVVLMNPPYGTRIEHVDKIFLEKSFQIAPVTYSIHKSTTRRFVEALAEDYGRKITDLREMRLKIPHLFDFHNRKWADVKVGLYRVAG